MPDSEQSQEFEAISAQFLESGEVFGDIGRRRECEGLIAQILSPLLNMVDAKASGCDYWQ